MGRGAFGSGEVGSCGRSQEGLTVKSLRLRSNLLINFYVKANFRRRSQPYMMYRRRRRRRRRHRCCCKLFAD